MAKPTNLTSTAISKLKADESGKYEIADTGAKGLRLRVSPTGWKSFIWRYMSNGKSKVYTIGRFIEKYDDKRNRDTDFITLADARTELGGLKAQHKSGILITAKEQQQKDKENAEAENKLKVKLETVIEDFYKTIEITRRRPDAPRQLIDAEILGKRKGFEGIILGNFVLREITTQDVCELINNTINRGAGEHAMKLLALLKQFFSWCENGGHIDRSPIDKLNRKYFGVKSEKVEHLFDISPEEEGGEPVSGLPEIINFFNTLDKTPKLSIQITNGLKILLLTGVRTGELQKAKIGSIKNNNWFILKDDTKTLDGWTVPLSPFVLQLFKELEDASDEECGFYLNCSDSKAMARAVNRLRKEHEWPPFTPHTLRKVFRTHIEYLGVPSRVAEKCLNHSLGKIEATYNKSKMLEQRREALLKWSDEVEKALKSDKNNRIKLLSI